MSLTGVGTNSLFKRIGVLGGWINSILNSQGAAALTAPSVSVGTAYTNAVAQFTSTSAQSDLFDTFYASNIATYRQKAQQLVNLKTFCQTLMLRMANDDVPLKSYTLAYAVQELIRQMGTATTTYVTPATVAATTPTAATGSTNTGTAVVTSSKTGPYLMGTVTGTNAMDLQYLFPETLTLKCTADSYIGGTSAYQETFSYQGAPALVTDPLAWNFTTVYGATATNGSGCSGTLSVCNAASYNNSGVGGNVLNNSDFATITSNIPNNWTRVQGVAGTDIVDGTSGIVTTNAHSLAYTGNSVAGIVKQQFANNGGVGGSTYTILPNTVYAIGIWMKTTGSTSGTVTLSLIDGTDTVINDNNAVANTLTQAASGITTSYVLYWTYFRTPAVLPTTGIFLRIQISAAPGVGKTLNMSNVAMRVAKQTYTGGPYLAIFSGATASVLGDDYSAIFTNDFGGLTNKVGFQQLANWIFDLRTMAAPPPISNTQPPAGTQGFIQLPLVGTTNIADSLVA